MAQEQSTPCMARPAFDVERTWPAEHAAWATRGACSLGGARSTQPGSSRPVRAVRGARPTCCCCCPNVLLLLLAIDGRRGARPTCCYCCSPLAAHGACALGGAPRTWPARSGRTGRRTDHADGVERASWRAATAAATWPCGRAAARRSGSSDVMQHSRAGEQQQQHAGRVLHTPPRPRAPLTRVLLLLAIDALSKGR